MSQLVWGFMHQTASPTCIKARQSLSKWDESLLRRSFARFRLKVNLSTFQVIFFSSSMSTCGCICMFSLSCSSGYMSDLLVPFINKCNTKLCFKYIELLFLECEIIFREKKWQEWLRQNLNDRVLICINCLESFVEPGNRAK